MSTETVSIPRERLIASRPFLIVGTLAIIGGGFLSALTAHNPQRPLMWATAYLVLVVGVGQWIFGIGESYLAAETPPTRLRHPQCTLFNLGNAGVILSQVTAHHWLLYPGTILFMLSMLTFLFGVRRARKSAWLWPYRLVMAILAVSSLVGIFLSWRLNG